MLQQSQRQPEAPRASRPPVQPDPPVPAPVSSGLGPIAVRPHDALATTLARAVGRRCGPILQRMIVVTPAEYMRGLNTDATNVTDAQIKQYFNIAVRDDVVAVNRHAGSDSPVARTCNALARDVLDAAKSNATRLQQLDDLVANVNAHLDTITVTEEAYKQDGTMGTFARPNRSTRYASTPERYAHTTPLGGVTWGSDTHRDATTMQHDVARVFGPLAAGLPAAAPRGFIKDTQELLSLPQVTWAQARTLFPRPLLNLLFDVRFQLEREAGNGMPIDERTPYERKQKTTTPSNPGTLRSWHTDSPQVLPNTVPDFRPEAKRPKLFDSSPLSGGAKALHDHYAATSGSGAGSSQSTTSTGPTGYAEYTGTGAGSAHDVKIVVDYNLKRLFVTLTHYQYWAVIEHPQGTYKFWASNTQQLDQAQGALNDYLVKNPGTAQLTSPWIEVLSPV